MKGVVHNSNLEKPFKGTFPNELLLLTISFLDQDWDHRTLKSLRETSRAAREFATSGYFAILHLSLRRAPAMIAEVSALGNLKRTRRVIFPLDIAFNCFEESMRCIEVAPELFAMQQYSRLPPIYAISLRSTTRILTHSLLQLKTLGAMVDELIVEIPAYRGNNRNQVRYEKWGRIEGELCEILRTAFGQFRLSTTGFESTQFKTKYCGEKERREGVNAFLGGVWAAERSLRKKFKQLAGATILNRPLKSRRP